MQAESSQENNFLVDWTCHFGSTYLPLYTNRNYIKFGNVKSRYRSRWPLESSLPPATGGVEGGRTGVEPQNGSSQLVSWPSQNSSVRTPVAGVYLPRSFVFSTAFTNSKCIDPIRIIMIWAERATYWESCKLRWVIITFYVNYEVVV